MPTGSEQVVSPRNAPRNSPELCIERRTLASHSSALPIETRNLFDKYKSGLYKYFQSLNAAKIISKSINIAGAEIYM